ncbi:chemotaxis protein CheW [Fulvivirgaceae bacterium PWU4]|uniref:Chemotaxis protein CheW n=1 Tax=Chryseosolibacter histidini TaxID=2782349 RepID=A0AAP2GPY7_9BACT|nr:chemotaxis protein CheW [Chryseosolibacter histidini]MBT1698425.1 chemotaxis protein CheW [Chryseosolibacter histidini]
MEQQTLTSHSYLTFRLGDETFAASVNHVLEILELSKITKVPRAPHFMRGVINLRGNVLPVIDTRIKFGLDKADDTVNTCILVMNLESEKQKIMLGALVDAVQEVREIEQSSIQPAPSIGSKYRSEFIEGMVKVNDQFVMILNLALVFTTDEVSIIQETAEEKISIA